MCVGSVCTQPPYTDKNPPSSFFEIPTNHKQCLRTSRSQIHRPLPRLLIDTAALA